MTYLLDTNACIGIIRHNRTILDHLTRQTRSQIFIPAVAVFELAYGVEKSGWGARNRKALDAFLSQFTVLDMDQYDSRAAGKVRADLEQEGKLIGPYDILIAGQALAKGMTVITNNTREFERVAGLTVEDWTV